ncbi:DUF5696 domain-containing protein [Paenibacillus alkaliterrae]|uniref:DUF5696 domain-containing protein n=1 Tax=Paenibacillus alkaliterrae TaxID=320909 RepID=UPI001F32560F|nr:DUF5696 domain-containing protein [Paenibacillus alkaliterrae]MCF2939244.1 DUF5696 domain-containing protein [Paenibacillus alkaliterrae]
MKKTGIMLLAVCVLAMGVVSWGYVKRQNTGSNHQETLAVSADAEGNAVTNVVPLSGTALENGMIEAASNEALSLYIHPATTEIAILDRASNEMWYSNPQDLKSNEKLTPLYQSLLSSQVKLSYYNEKGQVSTFNSFDDSVKKNQFEIGKVDQGVKVTYTLGNVIKGLDVIPLAISEKRFQEEIIEKVEDEKIQKSIIYKFAFDKDNKVYTPRPMQPFVVEEVAGILESIGYTSEDAAYDNKENGMESISSAKSIQFKVSVVYSLERDRLFVSVPTNEIVYPEKFPILSLHVLEYFGASGLEDQGYMFVPDGSGALIHLNNGKTATDPYKASVYGEDAAIVQKEKIQANMPIRMPVFGIVKGRHAMMGVIEEAEALASITADVSGRNHTYNYVSSQFDLMAADQISLSSGDQKSAIPVFQSRIYEGDLKISYSFLNGTSASYSGMAKLYRERLADQYGWQRISENTELPFVLQVEGAFPRKQSFLGVPYESLEPLTKYKEAAEISDLLLQEGISNIHLRYSGWFNGGIRHESPKDIQLESKLGGTRGFEELKQFSNENGITLYPDVAFLRKHKGSSDAAMLLNKKKAKVYEYSPVYYLEDKSRFLHYVLSPSALEPAVEAFAKQYKHLGVTGLSLRDLASDVNSDFKTEAMVDRQQSRNVAAKQTEKLGSSVERMMVLGGNVYAASYADIIVEAPLHSSRYAILDEDVPFYSMVLHGYVDAAGKAWNMDLQAGRQKLLKALETGSAVYYDWFYAEPSVVKDTKYDYLFSSYYKDWLNEASELYEEANLVLQNVRGQTIQSHEKLAEEIYRTTYENGFAIIVNYGDQAAAIDGIQIDAEGYWAGGD